MTFSPLMDSSQRNRALSLLEEAWRPSFKAGQPRALTLAIESV